MSGTGRADDPMFFATPAAFRRWLSAHHAKAPELWVGFHKRATGRPSLTWPESVDEVLCVGWIDGLRRSLGETSYTIRFTPRRPGSIWSAVNLRRVAELEAAGRMQPAGLAAFRARDPKRANLYSFESKPKDLVPAYAAKLRANARAWAFYEAQAPWYRRTTAFWVMSAKQEATRERRLAALIQSCERGVPIGPMKTAKVRTVGAVRTTGRARSASRAAAKRPKPKTKPRRA